MYPVFDPELHAALQALWSLPDRLGRIHRWRALEPLDTSLPHGPHQHPTPTLVAALRGSCWMRSPRQRLRLDPGDVLVVGPGVWHCHEPLRGEALAFGQGFFPNCSDIVVGAPGRGWTGRIPSEPSHLLMQRTVTAADPGPAVADLLRQVLAERVERFELPHPAIPRMVAALYHRLHQPIDGGTIAAASGLSRSRAYALFSDFFGLPPHRALRRFRMELAAALLDQGLAVGAVALRCGMPERRSFARAFRAEHGCSPREWRRRGGEGPG